jgi:asparaginyl-tRNA synthetase
MSIRTYTECQSPPSENVTIHGWIQNVRKQNDICFILVNDGSNASGMQIVCDAAHESFETCKTFNMGMYIKVSGLLIESPAPEQKYELKLHSILYTSICDAVKYPIKKRNTVDTLRQVAHMRTRTKLFGCIMRIRNTVMYHTHKFFQQQKYMHLDPNVLTINECEGGAGVFQATEWCPKKLSDIPARNGVIDWKKDHFKKPVYLTVSSQLQLEALACSLGNVYTTNKSFRAEHSATSKHMSEFTHLEIEAIDCVNNDLMSIGETYISYIIDMVFLNNFKDMCILDKTACKGLIDRYEYLRSMKFHKVPYKTCIEVLKSNGFEVEYGEDVSSEMENFLCKHYDGAVFVTNWPFAIKSFYMKQNDDGTCECFDLLMPYGIGELIGGSMREERLEKLEQAMEMKQVPRDGLEWYMDLRRFGTVPHGGFGLGLDRLLMLVTGMGNIKDVVPFPVYYQSCAY